MAQGRKVVRYPVAGIKFFAVLALLIFLSSIGFSATPKANRQLYPKNNKVKILATTYYAERFSDIGRYRRVSKNGKRLGSFVALNFLPGGSIIKIPSIFRDTKFEVADTFGKSGIGKFKGAYYWKVDILRNTGEIYHWPSGPVDMVIIKINNKGRFKNSEVRQNFLEFFKKNCTAF